MSAKRNPLAEGPWLSRDSMGKLPAVRREFDLNRDPYIRRQILDLEKTETQRREEQGGRGSRMVGKDKPAPSLRPPKNTGKNVDRKVFRDKWLAEQRGAAMAQARKVEPAREPDRTLHRTPDYEPSR